jgi:hypothetical protein
MFDLITAVVDGEFFFGNWHTGAIVGQEPVSCTCTTTLEMRPFGSYVMAFHKHHDLSLSLR